jgi:hypothetical protein
MKKTIRQTASIIFALAVLIAMLPEMTLPAKAVGRKGTDSGYYDETIATAPASNLMIETEAQLAGFAVAVNAGTDYTGYTVMLGNDLDMSTAVWTPIGPVATNYFKGTFNGANHTVSGLTINTSDNDYNGFFGFLGSPAVIESLNLSGTLTASGITVSMMYAGGLTGFALNADIFNCAVDIDVTATNNPTAVATQEA